MPTNVAIDYRMSQSSGIGVYLRHVVRELAGGYGRDFSLTLLGGSSLPGVAGQKTLRSPIYSVSEQVELAAKVPRSTDILWSPNYNAPLVSPGSLVVTVHDVCHLALPQFFNGPLKQRYARLMFANVKRRAARVICDSQFTLSEVNRLTGLEPERMTVIYPGLSASWRTPSDRPRPIDAPYLLVVGNVKPHKNLGRLLQAFALSSGRIPHTLAIVGKREGFITPDRAAVVDAERLSNRIVFTGEVSDEVLRSYYAHADLLVFPSLYEGFGFPPLEAMATGVPVAASNAASIPEVCGDAAAYFDPHSVEAMSAVIEQTLSDERLRARLRTLGMQQIERYSWATTTSRIAAVFRDVAERNNE